MSEGTATLRRVREVVLRDPRGGRWRAEVPTHRRERMRGLIDRDRLEYGRALLLPRTRSIHTFGMRFPLTVALLGARFQVIEVRIVCTRRIVLPRRAVHH